jgi:hypothetical protein
VRKALLVLLALSGVVLLPGRLSAQATVRDGQLHQGDLGLELGLGFGAHGTGFGFGIAALPGIDWTLADWKLGGAAPLALGVGAKGSVEFIPATGVGVGADALVSLHTGFKGLDTARFLQNLDVYTALGIGAVYVGEATVPFGLVFPAVYLGGAWYFRENLAVYFEAVYRNGLKTVGYGGAGVGLRLKRSSG